MNRNLVRRRIDRQDPSFTFEWDIPGPYTIQWSPRTAAERFIHTREHPIPAVTGLVFAAAPFVIGSALIAFGPHPAIKAAGYSMIVPTGVGELFWFSVGYGVGMEIEDELESWFS